MRRTSRRRFPALGSRRPILIRLDASWEEGARGVGVRALWSSLELRVALVRGPPWHRTLGHLKAQARPLLRRRRPCRPFGRPDDLPPTRC